MELILWRIYDHNAVWATQEGFDPLDGKGGLYAPGRWNSQGTRVVYLGSSAALAVLETIVHTSSKNFGLRTLLQLAIEAPSVEDVALDFFHQLRHNATDPDREEHTRLFGDNWVSEARSLLLRVPSVAVPFDANYLLNPQHPEASRVKQLRQSLIALDNRLMR